MLCELSDKRPDRASPAGFALALNRVERSEPAVDPLPAVKVGEKLVLSGQHSVSCGRDDSPDQVVAILKVVVELASARVCTGANLIKAHAGRPALGDQLGGGLHDARTRPPPFLGGRLSDGHIRQSMRSGLDSPLQRLLCWPISGLISPILSTSQERTK